MASVRIFRLFMMEDQVSIEYTSLLQAISCLHCLSLLVCHGAVPMPSHFPPDALGNAPGMHRQQFHQRLPLSLSPHSAVQTISLSPLITMVFRALRIARALPFRRNAIAPCTRRAVTTDAASSHAEREHVPQVCTPDRERQHSLTALEIGR